VRSLGQLGIKPYLLSFRKYSLGSFSKYSNAEIILVKDYTQDELLKALIKNKIELIILVGTNSFMKIVPWKQKLKDNNINIITVDEKKQNIAFSKKKTYNLAKSINIPIANTYYPKILDEINSLQNKITYPCVIKGLYEVGGNIVDYAYTKDELEKKYNDICQKYKLTEDNGLPMLQEYIRGDGCAFFAVYNNGKCGLTFQHRRIREYPVSGGASVCAESYKNDKVEEYGKKLLDSLNWHGVAMVEFKLNDNKIPILMEINPKFWGSIDLALEAGVNFPKALIDIHFNNEVKYSNKYQYPFKYHWPLHGDIQHGLENIKALKNIIRDIFSKDIKSNIWLKDFMPTFKMFFTFSGILILSIYKRITKYV